MTRARDIANLVDANGDIVAGALDNVPAADVVNDTTPQLGGDLQSNGNDVVFADNDKAIFGAGSNLQIYHDGSNSIIAEASVGSLKIQGSDLYLTDDDGTNMIYAANNAGVSLYHGGGARLATTSSGVDVTGKLQGGGTALQYSSGLTARESTHATSRRASIDFGVWTVGQDAGANGTKDFFFYDGVALAHRMNIDTSGRVTMPYQPAFHCSSYVSNTASSGVFVLGSTQSGQSVADYRDNGSDFSTSTGRFTAPVAGWYFFSAMASPSLGANSGIYIRKNGSQVSSTAYVYGQPYNGGSVSAVVNMAANDYAEGIHQPFNGTTESQYSGSFTGFLIG